MGTTYLSLDLEMLQPSGLIIQIGACIGDLRTGEVYESFSQLVCQPEPVSPFIEQLTGISTADLQAEGIPLSEAYARLLEFRAKYDNVEYNPIVWGGNDMEYLKRQLGDGAIPWPFGYRIIDVKTIFQFIQIARGAKTQAGLAKAMIKSGLSFQGRKHNAKDDAVNTFRLAHQLLANVDNRHNSR